MADYGLEIYSEDGSPWMEVTDRLVRILGKKHTSSSGSLTNDGLTEGTPFYCLVSDDDGDSLATIDHGYRVSFSGNKMTWKIEKYFNAVTIIYGVY